MICNKCKTPLEGNDSCPVYCPECNDFFCPECGNELTEESDSEESQTYCGNGCTCGWSHCKGCI
jgi:hypothetical protein